MSETKTLYRPTGIHEIALVIQTGLKEFPPRLPQQPIFYPVLTIDYAAQIARDWNAPSEGRAGFVTRFELDAAYAAHFEEHVVGSATVHRELWVPAEELAEFNSHIVGIIQPVRAYYGDGYTGLPARTSLVHADVPRQFLKLAAAGSTSRIDFLATIETNWDVILLNFAWWAGHDFSASGLSHERRDEALRDILIGWRSYNGRKPIPGCDPVGAKMIAAG